MPDRPSRPGQKKPEARTPGATPLPYRTQPKRSTPEPQLQNPRTAEPQSPSRDPAKREPDAVPLDDEQFNDSDGDGLFEPGRPGLQDEVIPLNPFPRGGLIPFPGIRIPGLPAPKAPPVAPKAPVAPKPAPPAAPAPAPQPVPPPRVAPAPQPVPPPRVAPAPQPVPPPAPRVAPRSQPNPPPTPRVAPTPQPAPRPAPSQSAPRPPTAKQNETPPKVDRNDRADRGDGRDSRGRFSRGNNGRSGKDAETRALDRLEKQLPGRIIRDQRRASIRGSNQGRYYDGLIRNRDGTYTAVEIKSNTAKRTPAQRKFDSSVSKNTPATVRLPNGQTVRITRVIELKVKG